MTHHTLRKGYTMKILLSGSSGLVGTALLERLFQDGHSITCLKRQKAGSDKKIWNTDRLTDDTFDAVIHLAGDSIVGGRWTKGKKQRIRDSRILGTRELVQFLGKLTTPPKVFCCASAVGYYGSRGDTVLTESSPKGTGFLADICRDWEEEAGKIASRGCRVVNLRFGMILSPRGGALQKMLPAFRLGLGGKVGNGQQIISWVSIRDIEEIVPFILAHSEIEGPVNVVSPQSTTNAELGKNLGKILSKPTFMVLPRLMASIIAGSEITQEMLLASTKASPQKLVAAGYEFRDKSLNKTLLFCLEKNA
ncbi:conserved hypothetical protein [Desulfotalea psychrophila LSv54]|uniref:TIGR01777 family protein n=2 Tax=Desulfotalea psychrophila TaxID=84980 RepID=Q6AK96_DESPS|nr:conserved hypothetical protein [Desulfotalea psychrophila LSv54]